MTNEEIEEKLKWLKDARTGLELAESLEEKHGLEFTPEEKRDLELLREKLPALEAVFRKVNGHPTSA